MWVKRWEWWKFLTNCGCQPIKNLKKAHTDSCDCFCYRISQHAVSPYVMSLLIKKLQKWLLYLESVLKWSFPYIWSKPTVARTRRRFWSVFRRFSRVCKVSTTNVSSPRTLHPIPKAYHTVREVNRQGFYHYPVASVYCNSLLTVGHLAPRYSHPALTNNLPQFINPAGRRTSYTAFSETRSLF